MNKTALIWVGAVVVAALAILAWKMQTGEISYDSRSGFEYESQSNDAMVGPEQGVDDIAAEADSTANLDGSVDSDLEQLDKELQGIQY